ncbi:MAG: CoA transferase [Chloroflexota bacterium]|nr:CoA transferase [Chloroflexota bacterium]
MNFPPGGLPLAGVRVLDFSHAAAGPYATMYLADMGAEVIKVEKPGRGDGARYMGEPMLGPTDSDYYLSLNRNKKSALIDLSTEAGVDLAKQLAAQSDVVAQNFRPGVMDRLGLGFETLRHLRPGLIYCSISAFGPTGPWKDRPANDIIMQSISGLMGITGEVDGGPVRIGAPISDYATGLYALAGILAALYARADHPEGQHVEVAMLDAALAMMCNYIPSVSTLGKKITRVGRGHAQIVPYQGFLCSDGEYVMVGAFTQGFWRRLCHAVGHDEWIEDPRFLTNAARLQNRQALMADLERIFLTKTRAEWVRILEEADVPNSPVLELHDAIKSEQALHNRIVHRLEDGGRPVDVVRSPIQVEQWPGSAERTAPAMGRDTREVLRDVLKMDEQTVAALREAGVIALAEEGSRDR